MKNIVQEMLTNQSLRSAAAVNAAAVRTEAMEPWLH